MKYDNPINVALVDIDKDQYWLSKKINRSRQYTNSIINRKLDSWVMRRKIANALGKPESELFPDGN